jgi:hypothetical protein
MSVLSIEDIFVEDDLVNVIAVVEDSIVTFKATYFDPEELGSGLCSARFCLDEDETLPTDENELLKFIDSLDLEWNLIDTSDYDDF